MSLAQELTVAGLRVLEQAADAEAHRWFAGRTGQEVRRRRAELLESWGQQVHEYPVLVEHLDRVLRAEPGETAPRERNELLLLLSLTPGGLAVPVEQLGKWLRPHQPPARAQILGGLTKLHGIYREVPTALGVRDRPPGENEGERSGSVADELTRRAGVPVWDGGRLTARAVTVLGGWAVKLGYQQAVSESKAQVDKIATVLFGHAGERAVAFVEQYLDMAGIPHDASPQTGARDLDGVDDDEPVTSVDRLRMAKITADTHVLHYGSVNARLIAAILAGRDNPSTGDILRALDMLEYSGYSGHIRDTTLGDISPTAPDASLETLTRTEGT
ncbi:hypothetical protein ACFUMI_39230, partial [Streptomyces sp. NPDC057273]|uniref:hypothetical protein n=1 Tax=Streptomyces sp. NPDC057273 TaxID=3346080 RepID=UPI0036454222